MKKIVIFDADGVLFDSLELHKKHMQEACFHLGIDFIKGLNGFLQQEGSSVLEFDNLLSAYKQLFTFQGHYSEFYSVFGVDYYKHKSLIDDLFTDYVNPEGIEVFDGLSGLLNDLSSSGLNTSIVTSNYQDTVNKLLEGNELFFDYVVCNEDVEHQKPHPEGLFMCLDFFKASPSDAYFIGDTIVDSLAAEAADIDFIGVTYGYTPREVLVKYPHVALVDSVESLKKVLLSS